jgi:hypothetical protein
LSSVIDAELALLAKLPTMYPILRSSLGMHVPDPAYDDIDAWRYQTLFHPFEVSLWQIRLLLLNLPSSRSTYETSLSF